MKISTGNGDKGYTKLLNGKTINKGDPRIEACGTVDELSSFIGYTAAITKDKKLKQELIRIQKDLYLLSADLANLKKENCLINEEHIKNLEKVGKEIKSSLPEMRKFTLPGGTESAALLHITRTVCRRAERTVVRVTAEYSINPAVLVYLNRLSTILFLMARKQNFDKGIKEIELEGALDG